MKKLLALLLAMALFGVFAVGASAAVIGGGTVEPMYDVESNFKLKITITEGRINIGTIYNISNEPVSLVKITLSLTRRVGLAVFVVALDGGEYNHVYSATSLDGSVTVGADVTGNGTYTATAVVEITGNGGIVTTDTLTATAIKS